MTERKAIHDRVLKATSKTELAAAYDEWADQYDRDLLDELGYVAPRLACESLLPYLEDQQATILDAGCGTGLVGQLLRDRGFRQLDGLDYSHAMLAKARDKQLYRQLFQADLTAPLDLEDDCYDAVISVGAFTCGHIGPEAFAELIRVTKPGGHICFTVRDSAWEDDEYPRAMAQLAKQGLWQLQEEQSADYLEQEGSRCKICVYQKTA